MSQSIDASSNVVDHEAHAPAILFADDEADILSALKRLFRSSGCKLLTADSGQAGLDVLAAEPVDLIISDMRMPGINGGRWRVCCMPAQIRKFEEIENTPLRISVTEHAE